MPILPAGRWLRPGSRGVNTRSVSTPAPTTRAATDCCSRRGEDARATAAGKWRRGGDAEVVDPRSPNDAVDGNDPERGDAANQRDRQDRHAGSGVRGGATPPVIVRRRTDQHEERRPHGDEDAPAEVAPRDPAADTREQGVADQEQKGREEEAHPTVATRRHEGVQREGDHCEDRERAERRRPDARKMAERAGEEASEPERTFPCGNRGPSGSVGLVERLCRYQSTGTPPIARQRCRTPGWRATVGSRPKEDEHDHERQADDRDAGVPGHERGGCAQRGDQQEGITPAARVLRNCGGERQPSMRAPTRRTVVRTMPSSTPAAGRVTRQPRP